MDGRWICFGVILALTYSNLWIITKAYSDPRIVGGTVAEHGQIPYQVFLGLENTSLCGGSIIAEDFVLTAAHCVNWVGSPAHVIVGAGQVLLSLTTPTVITRGKWIAVHENYNRDTGLNDIALIKLEEKLDLSGPNVKAIEMQNSTTVVSGTVCQVSGWGQLGYDQWGASATLLYSEVPLVGREECNEKLAAYNSTIDENRLCAGYVNGGRGPCQGDSGGPLVCDGLLTGIISRGVQCAYPDVPAVYVDVAYYRDWIEEHKMDPDPGSASLNSLSWGTMLSVLAFLYV